MSLNNRKFQVVSFILLTFTLLSSAHGFEAWWQCSSRQGGDWTFGRAPSICLVDHMQSQSSVANQFSPVLFLDEGPRTRERNRYMTEMNAVAKEMARYYLKKRKPSVSEAEIAAFTKGLLTLMHQETVWSHYRKGTDDKVRYMRGDSGHGHGLMQVDDRSHQTALLQGKGVDLIHNMVYGLDVFYAAWERAPSQSCVSSATNYTNRIRSAWAAYNGGPSRICRWTSTTGPFADHDKQFLSKLNAQSFKNYVTTENLKTRLDLRCLAEGSRPCTNNGTDPEKINPTIGELYQVGTMYCRWGNPVECLSRLNDVACLEIEASQSFPLRGQLSSDQLKDQNVVELDRNQLCGDHVKGLYEVSQVLQLKKNINIRKTPGGEKLGVADVDFKTKVLDFEVTSSQDQSRYYKINVNGVVGYVYAGNSSDSLEWAVPINDSEVLHPVMASIGEQIEIIPALGINMRASPGGNLMQRVPKGVKTAVLDRVIQGTENYLYYLVSYNGRRGYIYSGFLKDQSSVNQWTRVLRLTSNLTLASDVGFRFLKSCPQAECEFTNQVVTSQSAADELVILSENGDWLQVTTVDKSKTGWIRRQDLNL